MADEEKASGKAAISLAWEMRHGGGRNGGGDTDVGSVSGIGGDMGGEDGGWRAGGNNGIGGDMGGEDGGWRGGGNDGRGN